MKQITKKPDYRKIRNTVYNAYAKDGMQAAFKLAESYGCKYEFCIACDCETPVIKHDCLICGQTTAPANEGHKQVSHWEFDEKGDNVIVTEGMRGHTPGEWYVGVRGNTVYSYDNSTGFKILVECDNGEEAEANARLIASAPTLLKENEQLKEQVRVLKAISLKTLSFLADLNGSDWIKGDGAGELDMRQRAKRLQSTTYNTLSQTETK